MREDADAAEPTKRVSDGPGLQTTDMFHGPHDSGWQLWDERDAGAPR